MGPHHSNSISLTFSSKTVQINAVKENLDKNFYEEYMVFDWLSNQRSDLVGLVLHFQKDSGGLLYTAFSHNWKSPKHSAKVAEALNIIISR